MKTEKLIIIGAGNSADEIYPIVKNNKYFKKSYKGIPIHIGLEKVKKFKDSKFIFGIGSYNNKNSREKIFKKMKVSKSYFPNFIHSSAIVEDNVKMGFGNILYPLTTICSGTNLADFSMLTYSCIIAHNVKIGSFSLFGSRTSILNNTNIGKNVFCGANVLFAENLKIGDSSTIIFGSTIMCNIPRGKTVYGNPGEIINHG
jgi:acetyltransferase-like isoleucine patch superfamily enzyme